MKQPIFRALFTLQNEASFIETVSTFSGFIDATVQLLYSVVSDFVV